MNKIKLFVLAIIATFSLAPFMGAVAMAETPGGNVNCGSQGNLTGTCTTTNPEADTKINSVLTLVIRIFQIIVGLIAVIMIIFGGLKYVTSGGEAAGIGSAKNTIIYALIGIVVVVLAQVIVQFVLNRVNTVGTGI